MTNLKLSHIIFFQLVFVSIYSQTQTAETFTLDRPIGWNTTYIAKTSIRMNQGFTVDCSTPLTFSAYINPSLMNVPANGGNGDMAIGLAAGFNNPGGTNTSPGALPSIVDVVATGAATCNISLEFPEGFAGMSPELSLIYNSQFLSSGIFGKGFNLSGLSAITRIPQDDNYDSDTKAITLTNTDRFALDGNRLILTGNWHLWCS